MARPVGTIKFSSDQDENNRLNEYVNELIRKEDGNCDHGAKIFLKAYIESCLPYIPNKNVQSIFMLIELALVTLKKNEISSGKEKLTGTAAQNLQHLSVVQEKLNKQLGLAKSIATSKRNTLGEDNLTIIGKSKLFKKENQIGTIEAARALLTPLQNSKSIPNGEHTDIYETMQPEKLIDFLRTAEPA
jgi:hypothetical protein